MFRLFSWYRDLWYRLSFPRWFNLGSRSIPSALRRGFRWRRHGRVPRWWWIIEKPIFILIAIAMVQVWVVLIEVRIAVLQWTLRMVALLLMAVRLVWRSVFAVLASLFWSAYSGLLFRFDINICLP